VSGVNRGARKPRSALALSRSAQERFPQGDLQQRAVEGSSPRGSSSDSVTPRSERDPGSMSGSLNTSRGSKCEAGGRSMSRWSLVSGRVGKVSVSSVATKPSGSRMPSCLEWRTGS